MQGSGGLWKLNGGGRASVGRGRPGATGGHRAPGGGPRRLWWGREQRPLQLRTGNHGDDGSSGPIARGSAGSGCGKAGAPGTVTLRPTIGGRARVIIVHLPSGYRGTTPVPLVLNMHGSQSTALAQEALTGMDATSDADDFIVAYPQGDIRAGSGFEWNVPGQPLFGGAAVPSGAPDDVSFLEHLVILARAEVLRRQEPRLCHRLFGWRPDGQPTRL